MFNVGDKVIVNEKYGIDDDNLVGRTGVVIEANRQESGSIYPYLVSLDEIKNDQALFRDNLFLEHELDHYVCRDDN